MAKKVYLNATARLAGILLTNGSDMITKKSYDSPTKSFIEDEDGKYSVSFIIPKDSPKAKVLLDTFEDVVTLAYNNLDDRDFYDVPLLGDKKSSSFIKDGDDKDEFTTYLEAYANAWVITAKTAKDYVIKDMEKYRVKFDEVTNDEFYAGCTVTAVISIYYHDKNVYASIQGVAKQRDGNKLFTGFELDDDALDMDIEDKEFFDNYEGDYEGE